MNAEVLTPAKANFHLTLWNARAESTSSSELYLWLRESGLPSEIAIRLQNFISTTAKIGSSIICIGKIVLIKIIEFVKAHPNLVIGIAIGAAIGALVNMIPFLGTYLAPIAMTIGATMGAIAGHRIDKIEKGQVVNTGLIAVGQDIIEIAIEFFKLLINVFNTVFHS